MNRRSSLGSSSIDSAAEFVEAPLVEFPCWVSPARVDLELSILALLGAAGAISMFVYSNLERESPWVFVASFTVAGILIWLRVKRTASTLSLFEDRLEFRQNPGGPDLPQTVLPCEHLSEVKGNGVEIVLHWDGESVPMRARVRRLDREDLYDVLAEVVRDANPHCYVDLDGRI